MKVDFNSLYEIYNAGDLVLIIGSEVVRMKHKAITSGTKNEPPTDQNTCPMTFEQLAIKEIIDSQITPAPKTLSEVAIKHPEIGKKISTRKLKGIYSLLVEESFDDNLVQLVADLPKVNLYIQTSFDTRLKKVLGNDIETIVWNHDKKEPVYLNTINKKRKLFYLFGDTANGVSVFEEEQIDCLLNLSVSNEINKTRNLEQFSFLEYLKDKTLVFLGNNFPDWFMRLMIRTLYNGPVTSQPDKAYIVNDNNRPVQFERYFFDKFSIQLIHDYPIEEFLNNLHACVRKNEQFNNWYGPKRVFISYDRTEKQYANELKSCLNRKHIEAFLDTSDMGIAEHENKIKSFIRAPETSIFVCFLSATLLSKTEAESYAKRIEWKTAASRYFTNKYMAEDKDSPPPAPFIIVPCAIDDFNKYKDRLPEFIPPNNILPCQIQELCDLIEQEVKNIKYEYPKSI